MIKYTERERECCVLYAVPDLFLHNELYSRKRSIVYKDADVDLIYFYKAYSQGFISRSIGF